MGMHPNSGLAIRDMATYPHNKYGEKNKNNKRIRRIRRIRRGQAKKKASDRVSRVANTKSKNSFKSSYFLFN